MLPRIVKIRSLDYNSSMSQDPKDEIRRAMAETDVTASELKRRVTADISRILAGSVHPTWKTIQSIAHALGYVATVTFTRRKKP